MASVSHALDFANSVKRNYYTNLVNHLVTSDKVTTSGIKNMLGRVNRWNFAHFVYAEIFCYLLDHYAECWGEEEKNGGEEKKEGEVKVFSVLTTSIVKTIIVTALAQWFADKPFSRGFGLTLIVSILATIFYHLFVKERLPRSLPTGTGDLVHSFIIYSFLGLKGDKELKEWLLSTSAKLAGIWLYYRLSYLPPP